MKRILIIDDAATVRLYHRSILQEEGYLVEEAINGVEGMEKALQTSFDLYLVDVNMPLLDGYRFLQQIRSHQIRQVPAIVISTESKEYDREQAYVSGANLFMVKPKHASPLLKVIALLLRGVSS